jgi:acyl-CoA thioester hydrolase
VNEHASTVRVRYGETDQMGVVYHAHYLLYFEIARTELLRASGVAYRDLETGGLYLVVTEAACQYHAAARYDDLLTVRCRVAGMGKASIRFEYSVRGPTGQLLTEGHTELATVDAQKRPVRLPRDLKDRLSP